MSVSMKERQGVFDPKVIEWHEPENGTQLTLVLVRVYPDGHELLEKAGWRNRPYLWTMWVDGGLNEAGNDEFTLGFVTDELKDLIHSIKKGDIRWSLIGDGDTYKPSDVEVLKDLSN